MENADAGLAAAAERSRLAGQLRRLADFVGSGRKLTQTGRITLADARALVELLGTGDTIDPVIGDRVFKTTTSDELRGLGLVVDWAKAIRLVRTAKGRLLVVQKNLALLDRPLQLWEGALEALLTLGETVCPRGVLGVEFRPAMTVLLTRLYAGALRLDEASALTWRTASAPYRMPPGDEEHWLRTHHWESRRALEALEQLGAIRFSGADGSLVELSELGRGVTRRRLGEAAPGDAVYEISVTLEDVGAWRRLHVSAGIGLDRLHAIIQQAMGWENCHLHAFTAGGVRYGDADFELTDECATTLADLVSGVGTKVEYTYDFGDGWDHEIRVERKLTATEDGRYPLCLAGAVACPPEDCGGPGGYERLRQILADPDHSEHGDMLDWLGLDDASEFDPEAFDLERTNEVLARIG